MIRSVLIVSGGAMGSLFSGFLTAASQKNGVMLDVLLRANWKDHRIKIQKDGLHIHPHSEETKQLWKSIQSTCNVSGNDNESILAVNAVDDSMFDQTSSSFKQVDSVLLLEKSCYTEQCAHLIKKVLSPNGSCLTLQNGMGNVSILQSVLGVDRVLQGSTSQGAMISEAGSVEHTGIGYIKIASPTTAVKPAADWWVNTLSSIGLTATAAGDDFEKVLWEKLLINSAINPLTALYEVKNGVLRDSATMKELMVEIIQEGVLVARMACPHFEMEVDEMVSKTLCVCEQTAQNNSSMFSDILKKHHTEIDFINGFLVRTAKKYNISTPLNEHITKLIKAKEELICQ